MSCPSGSFVAGFDLSGSLVCGALPADTDGDGVPDADDNCPATPNPDQADLDSDGLGDPCDEDRDGDGLVNGDEFRTSPDRADSDADGTCDGPSSPGAACAPGPDNCPTSPNPDQADADGDGLGDVCELPPGEDGLYFSEYVEGLLFDKAIEIHNPTPFPVQTLDCSVALYLNGSVVPAEVIELIDPTSAVLAPGATLVLCNESTTQRSACDIFSQALSFTGNDALELSCLGQTLDVLGQIGSSEVWTSGGVTTMNATLRRKCSVTQGDANGTDPFDPALEWELFPLGDTSDLGVRSCP
jgi:hypothetical protein